VRRSACWAGAVATARLAVLLSLARAFGAGGTACSIATTARLELLPAPAAALDAAFGVVVEAALTEERLLRLREDEILSAVAARQRPIGHEVSLPFHRRP